MQNLDWVQVSVIFSLGLVNALMIGLFSVEQSKTAVVATIRSLGQLLLLGFFLQLIFDHDSWPMKILVILIMVFNGSYTLRKRTSSPVDTVWSFFVIMLISVLPGIILAVTL